MHKSAQTCISDFGNPASAKKAVPFDRHGINVSDAFNDSKATVTVSDGPLRFPLILSLSKDEGRRCAFPSPFETPFSTAPQDEGKGDLERDPKIDPL